MDTLEWELCRLGVWGSSLSTRHNRCWLRLSVPIWHQERAPARALRCCSLGPISAIDNAPTPATGASEICGKADIAQLLLPLACNTANFDPGRVRRPCPF